ncbi:MAG TPA: S8 family serine peptidase, partial [Thermoplasmata archaeon]|nr:S8 family serine peptidase [Thermoplasmata archaeon]
MRLASVLAAVVLAAAFGPLVLAPRASAESTPTSSYLVTLTDQRSHEASLAVRAAYRAAINAVVAERDSLVASPADLQDPVVLELNSRVDTLMGEMRLRIAAEATRLHAYARSILEPFIEGIGGTVTYRSPLLNLDVVQLPNGRVDELRAHPLVASVEPDLALDVYLDVSVPAVGAPTFWANGFQGGPFKLVVPDTGIDASHPALVGKISDAQTFHDVARNQGDYADDWTTTDDLHGHGTHIAGIVASQDLVYRGVAYGMLGVINVKFGYLTNTGNGRGIESDSMKGMDWGILTVGGDVLSLSFGGGSNDNGESGWGRYMDALVDDLGIPVSVAAGNSGPGSGTLGIPATSYNIITVGALDDMNTVTRADDGIASFSSRGPTGDGRLKPDISAPGSDIVSTNAFWETQSNFVGFWGTSMAAPHVGAGLLLQENANGAPGFPARSKAVLLQTATDMGSAGPDNTYGWGSMNLAEAWTYRNAVIEGNAAVGTPVFYRIPGGAGDRATMVWQKHVVYNGINFPNVFFPLNNLDLNLYDETTGTRMATSARTRDNVEQVSFTGATTGVAKVFVTGTMNGVTQEPFALAAKVAPVAVAAPAMSVVVCCTRQVDSGSTFQVTVNVSNVGGLRIFTSTVTLNLPPGITIVAGANPTSLGAISAGTTNQATWTLTSIAVGTHTVNAGATGSAFEEVYSASGNPVQITVLDVTPPTILNHGGAPSPQNVGGFVNVSAAIADNVGVAGAWLEVTD